MDAVVISHPDKVLFPDDGITKGELAAYYRTVSPHILPHIRGRPVTMERFNRGIGTGGFIQKSIGKGTPEWIERVEVPKKGGTVRHPLINDARSLQWLANQNCITPHVWAARVPNLYHPDICIFDLDPLRDDPAEVRGAALALRDLLSEFSLTSWVKTTGSKGFHIAVPLDGNSDAGEVAAFAHRVSQMLVSRYPRQLTMEFSKADRGGRIYVDAGRNHPPATYAAPYAVRPQPAAPVSAPCAWRELEAGNVTPRTFTLRDMQRRLADSGELWSSMHRKPHSLKEAISELKRVE